MRLIICCWLFDAFAPSFLKVIYDEKKNNKWHFTQDNLSFLTFFSITGHGNIFSCCQNDNLRGLPVSFFMIHILGGMVLFMTDGIVVSEECSYVIKNSHIPADIRPKNLWGHPRICFCIIRHKKVVHVNEWTRSSSCRAHTLASCTPTGPSPPCHCLIRWQVIFPASSGRLSLPVVCYPSLSPTASSPWDCWCST